MQIKGAAIQSTHDYMYTMHREMYDSWFKSLPAESQYILMNARSSGWYPVIEAAIIPTRQIGMLIFRGDIHKGAFQAGKYSAMSTLHGLYKLYVRFSSPSHVIERGARILASFYRPSSFQMLECSREMIFFEINDCDQVDEVIEYRMAGWIHKALEMSGCSRIEVQLTESFVQRGKIQFRCNWQ